ncbi:ABC transporter permease [Streptomyces viridochromogenes]|uniref:Putative Binding-protein-dependent transport systems inner membrane component n=1 Tax=Streptomyces viridochromogenes Tue57 TaxID=1160705 RepID=L8PL50_STRVR|nr:ABC transporter permease [Streptomyces viridochromogenes]ELS58236.1 putative Binding-protein-dependent transport systems inner membrane component [Streptomyces viridochromogenes Tue57]
MATLTRLRLTRLAPTATLRSARLRNTARTLSAFALLIALWALSAQLLGLPADFYPTPSSVWQAAKETWSHGLIPTYLQSSLWRWLVGVGIGLAAALPVALLLSLSRTVSDMLMPLLNFFHAIVELAWLPLFVLWFGYSFTTVVLSIAYVVFFLVVYNTLVGIRQVPASTVNALRTLGASRAQITREALVPGALPNIVTGIRLGAGFGWRSLVGAEMLTAASNAADGGLGFMIFTSYNSQQFSRIVVGMVLIGLLWLAIDRLYLRPLEAATVERWGLVRRAR